MVTPAEEAQVKHLAMRKVPDVGYCGARWGIRVLDVERATCAACLRAYREERERGRKR